MTCGQVVKAFDCGPESPRFKSHMKRSVFFTSSWDTSLSLETKYDFCLFSQLMYLCYPASRGLQGRLITGSWLFFCRPVQVCSAGSRLIVQESIAERMVSKLKERMTHLRLGDSLDKVHQLLPLTCISLLSSLPSSSLSLLPLLPLSLLPSNALDEVHRLLPLTFICFS